jgi:Txe/YoeB family toxin of toxin-antitoxin system
MNSYEVFIKNSAKKDLRKIKQSHLIDNFNEIVKVLKEDPFEPTQSFEKLQPKSAGLYSRRINQQHRVVYKVDEDARRVEIYSTWTHYE